MALIKRSLLAIFACVLALALLVACAGKDSTAPPIPTPNETPTPKPTPQLPSIPLDEVTLTVSGELPSSWQKTTIPEVELLLGQQLPVPTYLPTSYEIKEVYYHQALHTKPQITYILLLISDLEVAWVGNRYRCRLVLEIGWKEMGFGLKMPWARYIPAVRGRLEEKGDEYILWWEIIGVPESESSTLRLYANREFPKDELINIAASTLPNTPS